MAEFHTMLPFAALVAPKLKGSLGSCSHHLHSVLQQPLRLSSQKSVFSCSPVMHMGSLCLEQGPAGLKETLRTHSEWM